MNKHTTPTTHKRPRAPEEAPKRVTVLNLQFENYYDNYHSNSYRTSIGATQNKTTNIFQHHTIYSFLKMMPQKRKIFKDMNALKRQAVLTTTSYQTKYIK